jgi:hypothetical protein
MCLYESARSFSTITAMLLLNQKLFLSGIY